MASAKELKLLKTTLEGDEVEVKDLIATDGEETLSFPRKNFFRTLGLTINQEGSTETMRCAQRAIAIRACHCKCLGGADAPLGVKLRGFIREVRPIQLYGGELWTSNRPTRKKPQNSETE